MDIMSGTRSARVLFHTGHLPGILSPAVGATLDEGSDQWRMSMREHVGQWDGDTTTGTG